MKITSVAFVALLLMACCYVSGYQGYPAAAPPPTAVSATTVATVTPCYGREALATTIPPQQQPSNGTFQAALQAVSSLVTQTGNHGNLNSQTVPQTSRLNLQLTCLSKSSISPTDYTGTKQCSSSTFPGKGIKRKRNDSLTDSSDGNSKSFSYTNPLQPLYCKICRVTLNAPAQAKQHYEGKSHAKKVKLYTDNTGESTEGKDQVRCHRIWI